MGSSPLTRGKRQGLGVRRANRGLIPAHAGKTAYPSCPTRQRRAHPRSRGENLVRPGRCSAHAGSSPLTRGKLVVVWVFRLMWGLIPAHAGKTSSSNLPRRRPRAHPRSRGENGKSPDDGTCTTGSSPLTRGKLVASLRMTPCVGLIPAHAGKTRGWVRWT